MKHALPLTALLFFASCQRLVPGDRPKIVFGRDACARCGMLVSEARFASGYVDTSGKSVIFDDIGELLAAAAEDQSFAKAAFVTDVEDGDWTHANTAFYTRVPTLATPMGTGVAAFKNRARAEAFAKQHGGDAVLNWNAASRSRPTLVVNERQATLYQSPPP